MTIQFYICYIGALYLLMHNKFTVLLKKLIIDHRQLRVIRPSPCNKLYAPSSKEVQLLGLGGVTVGQTTNTE